MRINARLDEETQSQLNYLVLCTGQSASQVVRESVAQYFLKVKQGQRPPSRFLALVGSSGRTDVASNVKSQVAQILAQKFALSHPVHKAAAAVAGTSKPARRSRK